MKSPNKGQKYKTSPSGKGKKTLTKNVKRVIKNIKVDCSKCGKEITLGQCCVSEVGTGNRYHITCHSENVAEDLKDTTQVLTAEDHSLSGIVVGNPCNIKLEITQAKVTLIIGPRIVLWNRSTGEHVASDVEESLVGKVDSSLLEDKN